MVRIGQIPINSYIVSHFLFEGSAGNLAEDDAAADSEGEEEKETAEAGFHVVAAIPHYPEPSKPPWMPAESILRDLRPVPVDSQQKLRTALRERTKGKRGRPKTKTTPEKEAKKGNGCNAHGPRVYQKNMEQI